MIVVRYNEGQVASWRITRSGATLRTFGVRVVLEALVTTRVEIDRGGGPGAPCELERLTPDQTSSSQNTDTHDAVYSILAEKPPGLAS
jgi:hypothetical protein